jgi:2'-5' RNA ligase
LNKRRLFVAVGLPDSLIAELDQLQRDLKPFARDAKWVKASGIHLTLKFLGYVEQEKIPTISDALLSIAKEFSAASVRSKGCGFFPNARRPNVLWVGVESNLQPLQQAIEEEMSKFGFEKEKRAFSPHLTLARFKDPKGLLPLAKEAEKFSDKIFGEFTANGFTLYESILRPQGAEYHSLQKFSLNKSNG